MILCCESFQYLHIEMVCSELTMLMSLKSNVNIVKEQDYIIVKRILKS